jgi:hypothetical protein
MAGGRRTLALARFGLLGLIVHHGAPFAPLLPWPMVTFHFYTISDLPWLVGRELDYTETSPPCQTEKYGVNLRLFRARPDVTRRVANIIRLNML